MGSFARRSSPSAAVAASRVTNPAFARTDPEHVADDRLVVEDEDGGHLFSGRGGQGDGESGPALSRGRHGQRAAVRLDDIPRDGEPESRSALRGLRGIERLEHAGRLCICQARSVVLHGEQDVAVVRADAQT